MELLERELDFEQLTRLWHTAMTGQGRMVLVSGEAGIGKTALVEQFVRQLGQAARCLWGLRRLVYSACARPPLRSGGTDAGSLIHPPASGDPAFPLVCRLSGRVAAGEPPNGDSH